MEKILVTTDLSDNSLAGLRFAIQLATQRKLELIFFHVNDLWDDAAYREPAHIGILKQERKRVQHELESLVEATYQSMHVKPGSYHCVFYYHLGIVNSILRYAMLNDCDFICISTHGAGNVLKLLGSNTSELISVSEVPVLCVPRKYEPRPVSSILYACDMNDHEAELERVVSFAKALHASVQVLNVSRPGKAAMEKAVNEERLTGEYGHKISIILEKNGTNGTLADNIDDIILKYSPSMLVMFTNQDRNILELLFSPSQTQNYTFRTKIPLLAFPKRK